MEDFWNKKRIKISSLIFREYWSGICIFQYLEKRLDLILLQKSCSKSSPGFWESLSVFTKKSILTTERRKKIKISPLPKFGDFGCETVENICIGITAVVTCIMVEMFITDLTPARIPWIFEDFEISV